MWAIVAAVTGACYSPRLQEGAPCGANAACPSELQCIGGVCVRDAPPGTDAPLAIDAPLVSYDAPAMLVLDQPGTYSFDTDNGALLDPGGTQIAVDTTLVSYQGSDVRTITSDAFVLASGSTLRGTGSLPLGISGRDRVQIDGTVDVGSGGAAARASCPNGPSPGGVMFGGGGGGGGGGFGAAGGRGGDGNSNETTPGVGGAGGAAAAPTALAGGCPGAGGGTGEDAAGAGGAGGGALYVVSATRIDVAGNVQAGGGGGHPGTYVAPGYGDAGGGGGGAGGMIMIDAPMIAITGAVAANGGGGGGGSSWMMAGSIGQGGRLSTMPATGGASPLHGTAGGVGGSRSAPPGADVATTDWGGAGGGGGGVGAIVLSSSGSPVISGVVSPAP